jgi:GntR family transcriptional regulator, transcriptional repressor for pyruvate dehydrogenase complex
VERNAALEAVFTPVRAPTAFDETVERLGTAIRIGLLSPGTQLPPERDLATQLGISRSTLRHALTALVQSGHLTSVRGRSGGTFVTNEPPLVAEGSADPLNEDAWAVLDRRVAVEIGTVMLACERGSAKQFDALDQAVARMDDAAEFEEYRRADVSFHIGIADAAARSPRLVTSMTEVQGQMSDLISQIPHPKEVLTRSNQQHKRIVRSLRKGDATRAVRQMREHIEGTEHILAGLFPGGRRAKKKR